MSKHNNHHDSKNHVENNENHSKKGDNGVIALVVVGVAALIIGLALGFVLTTSYFTIAEPNEQTNLSDPQILEIKSKINSFILGQVDWSQLPEDISVVIDYNKDNYVGSLGEFLVFFKVGEEKQLAALIYADSEKFVLAQNYPVDLNSISEIKSKPSAQMQTLDVPEAELFIWSYCSYGVTALTPFAEVAKLLDSKANFSVKLYYAGHGEYENQQNMTQACIQKYEQGKYWDYAKQFVESVYSKCSITRDLNCDKTESISIMNSLGIDSNKIYGCVESEGAQLVSADSQKASEMGVTGSPTLFINGTKVNTSKTAQAYKTSVCSAFNTVPGECSAELNTVGSTTTGSC